MRWTAICVRWTTVMVYHSETQADRAVNKLRNKGMKARVVRYSNGYAVQVDVSKRNKAHKTLLGYLPGKPERR